MMGFQKVDYVEIGFRFIDKIKTKGPCAYSEESFLKSLKIPKNSERFGIIQKSSGNSEKSKKFRKSRKCKGGWRAEEGWLRMFWIFWNSKKSRKLQRISRIFKSEILP